MAGKFVELKEAAAQLGISPDKLQDMREAGEIHGYKDGASWKFKSSEIERVAKELGSSDAGSDADSFESASSSGDDFNELLGLNDASDAGDELDNSSILISEDVSGADEESSSTVVGKEKEKKEEDVSSDLDVADDSSGEGSSDVADVSSSSDDDDYELKLADSDAESEELALSDDFDFEADAAMALDDEGDMGLSVDSDEEEAVQPESGSSDEEYTVASSDSGSEKSAPDESGVALDESSSAGLELPEDDDLVSVENEIASGSDDATELQQDEEFLLSPSDSVLGDESSDSGSQVIALDDSSAFESDSDLEAAEAGPMLVPEEEAELEDQLEPIDEAAETAAAPVAGAEAPEADYSAWNILALLLVMLLLSVVGVLMADVVRNMWSWNGDVSVSSGLANSIVDALGMK